MIFTILLIIAVTVIVGCPILWATLAKESDHGGWILTGIIWLVSLIFVTPLLIEVNRRGPIADEMRAQNYHVISVDGLSKNVTVQIKDKLVECRVEEIDGKWGIVDSSTCKDVGSAPTKKSNELIGPEAFGG